MSSADDQYEQQNDSTGGDIPAGNKGDNDYVNRTGDRDPIPVQRDEASVEDPIDPATADSDQTLASDEKQAIDPSNIIDSRTRGAAKKAGSYEEPSDEQDMPPPEDGTSYVRTGSANNQ